MALMYTDVSGVLQGFLRDVSFDADIGEDNDFLLTVPKDKFSMINRGFFVFDSENPAFGGMIEGVEVDTVSDSVSFTGSTWFGLLEQKAIVPPSGYAYKTISGSSSYIIGSLIDELGFTDYFYVPDYDPESQGDGESFTFSRYITLLDGLRELLDSRGKVLSASYNLAHNKIMLTARTPIDYSNGQGLIKSPFNYQIKKPLRTINHMICLGRGELTSRTVIHLYLQPDGTISKTNQSYTGSDEVTFIYENTSAESQSALEKQSIKKFEELVRPKVEIDVATGTNYYIGDVIGGYEPLTKTKTTATIDSLVLQIDGDKKTISYKTKR